MNKKTCNKCGELKDISDFYFRKKTNSYDQPCKKCISDRKKKNKLKFKKFNLKQGISPDLNQVKSLIKQIEGYELVDEKYTKNSIPLKIKHYECSNIFKMTLSNFISGQRCPYCRNNPNVYWEDVVELFKESDFVLLSEECDFKTAFHSKLKIKCKVCNGIQETTYTSFKFSKKLCKTCNNLNKIKFSDIKQSFLDEGWKIFTKEEDYKNQTSTPYIKCMCPEGHLQEKHIRKWRMGRRCVNCTTSGPELRFRKYIEKLGIKCKYNDRKALGGTELDFYFKSLNKAIEFNGDYWHCNPKFYDENYINKHKGLLAKEIWDNDLRKKILCEERGIELLTIWNNEFENGKFKDKIKQFLL